MDHFAKPDDELFLAIEKGELHRNFQGYTTKGGTQLLGIGLTSIGYGENYYIQNFKDMKSYEKTIDNGELPIFRGVKLDEDDKIRKAVIMELMSNFKLNIKRLEKQFNINFKTYLQQFINFNVSKFINNCNFTIWIIFAMNRFYKKPLNFNIIFL